jgi:hypothetical protein
MLLASLAHDQLQFLQSPPLQIGIFQPSLLQAQDQLKADVSSSSIDFDKLF